MVYLKQYFLGKALEKKKRMILAYWEDGVCCDHGLVCSRFFVIDFLLATSKQVKVRDFFPYHFEDWKHFLMGYDTISNFYEMIE